MKLEQLHVYLKASTKVFNGILFLQYTDIFFIFAYTQKKVPSLIPLNKKRQDF